MNNHGYLETEKKHILHRMAQIESMRKGTISDQYIKTKLKDGSIKENGPYFILTSKNKDGKTVTESIPNESLEFFKQEIENYKEFKELANKYEYLSEESSKIKSGYCQTEEKVKKNRRSK